MAAGVKCGRPRKLSDYQRADAQSPHDCVFLYGSDCVFVHRHARDAYGLFPNIPGLMIEGARNRQQGFRAL
jgi:hypothetical protein